MKKYVYVVIGNRGSVIHPNMDSILSKSGLTESEIMSIQSGELSEGELLQIFNPALVIKQEEITFKKNVLNTLSDPIFVTVKDGLQLDGIPINMPELLVKEFYDIEKVLNGPDMLEEGQKNKLEKKKQALISFWTFCCANIDSVARDGLFDFVTESGLYISTSGWFVAYRYLKELTTSDEDVELHNFIVQSWIKVRRQKKSPKNFIVYSNGNEYKILNTKRNPISKFFGKKESDVLQVGNLDELYESQNYAKSVTKYTWGSGNKGTGLKTNEIIPGVLFTMDRNECDPNPKNSCSKGLHFTSWKNMGAYSSGYGSIKFAILINPMDVVAVPEGYAGNKGRCCAYLPLGPVDEPITDESGLFDYEYGKISSDAIKDLFKQADLTQTKNFLDISDLRSQFIKLQSTLEERSKLLNDRYKRVDNYEGDEEDYDDWLEY